MDNQVNVESIDKKMQEQGWKFLGPILHYEKAWKNQAAVYEKDGKYVVSGIDSSGKSELHKSITEKEAKKRLHDSLKEIRELIFKISK
jgi:hypothetical protein